MRKSGLSFVRSLPWAALAVSAVAVWASWNLGPRDQDRETPAASNFADNEAAEASAFDLLVDYRDGIGPETLAATPWTEEPLSRLSAVDKLYRIRFDSLEEAAAAAATLRRNPEVESVDWDAPATLLPWENDALDMALIATEGLAAAPPTPPSAACDPTTGEAHANFPNDPCYKYQWHLGQVGLPGAWKLGQGKGVIVAVIDTGVTKVPDLAGTELVPGYNFVADNDNAADDHGHGTHVAGTIAQATNNGLGVAGVAFGARVMPLKVLSAQGSGSMGAISQAIRYAADHGAKVINMSLGGPFPVSSIRSAAKYARDKGVFVVAAAGNDGRGRVGYPARYPEVFAVAATQFDETTTFYSNWGAEVDIAAPGGNVRVDQNGDGKPDGVLQNTVVPGNISKTDYLLFMGTSMASPHVAGVAALVAGAGVTQPDAIDKVLRGTARQPKVKTKGGKGGRVDDHYGAGIVDAGRALAKQKTTHGAGGLALGASLALLGLGGLRRRGQLARLGWAAPVAFVAGASGLFFLPLLFGLPSWLSFATVSVTEAVPATFSGLGFGNPLLLSAALPLAGIALLSGVRRLRPALGGLAFGVAGALLALALTAAVDVRYLPDVLDRAWLLLNAAACTVLGRSVLRK
jgi:serine protease